MRLSKVLKAVGQLFQLPNKSQPREKSAALPKVDPASSSSSPGQPASSPPPTNFPTTPVSYRVPVEVIERILFYVFPLSTDPTRSSTFPSLPPHPLSLLLASKGLYHLVLPFFYQSIRVLRGQDWITLFNPKYGILGARELGMGRASYDDRRTWVKELFVRGEELALVWIPWDLKGAKKKHLGRKDFHNQNPSFLQLQTLGPPLPHLQSIFILPYFDPSPSPEVLNLFKFLRLDRILGMRILVGGEYRNDLLDEIISYGSSLQNSALQEIDLGRSTGTSTFLHHPLLRRPQYIAWIPHTFSDVTWIVDCSGMDETSLGEALEESVRREEDPWDDEPSPYRLPQDEGSVVWTGLVGGGMRARARRWATRKWMDGESKPGWKFVMEDGSTRPFFERELDWELYAALSFETSSGNS